MECEKTFHPDTHMMLCHESIKEMTDVAEFIMTQLSLKSGMKIWKWKGREAASSDMEKLQFSDTLNQNNYKDLT